MTWLKSKKLRVGIGIAAVLVVIVLLSGFALSRGYLMHFLVNEQTISRNEFYQLAETAGQTQVNLSCTSAWKVGWLYLYETHCFDTETALEAYMHQ